MSLNRTALRLATVVALTNNVSAPFPTMAEQRVFDSRLDPAEIAEDSERQPYIVVYTDDDAGDELSTNNGGPPWGRTIDLVLHMAVGAYGELVDSETGQTITGFGPIETDAQIEALLDLVEYQAERALFTGGPWTETFLQLTKNITQKNSIRFGDPRDARVKYSERMVIYKVAMRDDWITDPPRTVSVPPGEPDLSPVLPSHIQALVTAISVPGSAYVAQTVETISAFGLPPAASVQAFQRMRIIEDERDSQNRRTNPRSQGDQPGVAQADLPQS